MRGVTYDSIQMLVDSAEVAGRTVRCVFSCPVTRKKVESTGRIPEEVGPELAEKLDDLSLSGRVRSALASVIWDVLRVGRAPGAGDADEGEGEGAVDEQRKRAGILDAFKKVSHRFVFDPQAREWLWAAGAGDLLNPFAVQLNDAPIEGPRDVEVAERMLVEVVRADGVFDDREREMLAGFVGDEERVEELAQAGPPGASDLAGVSEGKVRRTMLMLAWAAAFTDEDLADAERSVLARFAEGLGLSAGDAEEVRLLARDYVIDTAFDEAWANLVVEPGERRHLESLALALGATEEDVARIGKAYRKRMGHEGAGEARERD